MSSSTSQFGLTLGTHLAHSPLASSSTRPCSSQRGGGRCPACASRATPWPQPALERRGRTHTREQAAGESASTSLRERARRSLRRGVKEDRQTHKREHKRETARRSLRTGVKAARLSSVPGQNIAIAPRDRLEPARQHLRLVEADRSLARQTAARAVCRAREHQRRRQHVAQLSRVVARAQQAGIEGDDGSTHGRAASRVRLVEPARVRLLQ